MVSNSVYTSFLKKFGFVLMGLFNICISWMKFVLASSYTHLSTWPKVALHLHCICSLLNLVSTLISTRQHASSYHFRFNSMVLASNLTVWASVHTLKKYFSRRSKEIHYLSYKVNVIGGSFQVRKNIRPNLKIGYSLPQFIPEHWLWLYQQCMDYASSHLSLDFEPD